ncbi:MAG: hypothetical protein COZ06_23120 [Armatimonadetes bacterium CG_4_10_14_3_um_filter_66_18]|nr:hypothetical protein [Armatimonadota bacterium]OIP03220.1 MAG: hypothetical protein AUJ96_15000 [Armatimonadetes bacterium CG2_30_66_41]PIU90299.1 MAG: hypothetical protein COS65_25630 [Armatimonadetes bacterium CG06_land_8_20_14_3_00_66_21]PIW14957.1 MAG: hypothetical protein COW34_07155 [Armatimonadetes bacterium CG17_big_fil_post_rev_8_21_14_2_50_66_6]PIX45693.1 MAG: hypothetical protein COZ57_14650 [Armatimonadetes bacterium CG_4_8_14_3_um_filter_66_20]PIY43322.1 MAG: hypothetical prote
MLGWRFRLAVLLGLAVHAPAWAVRLAYRGQPGQVLHYSFTLSAETETTAGGRAQTLHTHGSLDCTQEIVDVDAQGHLKVRMHFSNGLLTSASGEHSARVPLNLPAAEVLLSSTGNVLKAQMLPGPQSVRSAKEPPETGTAEAATDSATSARGFESLFDQMRALGFPERDVEVGDSWSLSGSLAQPGGQPGSVAGVSQLVGVEQHSGVECAVIHSRLEIPLRSTQQLLGVSASTDGSSTATFTAYFDLAGGHLLELLGTDRSQRAIRLAPAPDKDARSPQPEAATLQCDCAATFTMRLNGIGRCSATPSATQP